MALGFHCEEPYVCWEEEAIEGGGREDEMLGVDEMGAVVVEGGGVRERRSDHEVGFSSVAFSADEMRGESASGDEACSMI